MEEDAMLCDGARAEPPMANLDSFEHKLQALLEGTPSNFEDWTSLIREVEKTSPNDIGVISMVYDAFLSEFPLCYGYWKKYAIHKARLCSHKEMVEVFERAVLAATYSVDIWVSYCSYAMLLYEDPADIRRLFERGLHFVGKNYLCHLLWDKYIEFEYSQKQWSYLANIYINTLRFPTKRLHSYYERFKKLVALLEEEVAIRHTEGPEKILSSGEDKNEKDGELAEKSTKITDLMNRLEDLPGLDALKKYISAGEQLYQKSLQMDSDISCFEARIRRHYFHVKPLDESQLQNWHQYLDFSEMQEDFDWTVKLYERCLIPCASYPEFWIRYVEFVDAKGGREIANYTLGRALSFFLKRVPTFRMYCAMFKEQIGDFPGARTLFLQGGADWASDLIANVNREANMEKRMGNAEAAYMIYEKAIEMAIEKQSLQVIPALYANFAQFTFVATGSIDAAFEIFWKGIRQSPCKSIIKELIHFIGMHGGAEQLPKLDSIISTAITPGSDVSSVLSSEDREDISLSFLEFVDRFGSIQEIRKAWARHTKLFPHIVRHVFHSNSIKRSCKDKNKEEGNGSLIAPIRASFDNGSSEHVSKLGSSQEVNSEVLCQEAKDKDFQLEKAQSPEGTLKEQVMILSVQDQRMPEKAEPIREVGEPTYGIHDLVQNVEACSENSETKTEIKPIPGQEFGNNSNSPGIANLSTSSSRLNTHNFDPVMSNNNNSPSEETLRLKKDGFQNDGDISKSNSSPLVDIPKNSSPSHPNPISPMAEREDRRNVGVYPQNTNRNCSAQVQASQPQEAQAHHQNPNSGANPQMPVSQGYPSQTQAWYLNRSHHQASAWLGQSMQQQQQQQQGFVQSQMSNEQYAYLQSNPEYARLIWQYYQQMYYLQFQQNQQMQQSFQQQEPQAEHLQQEHFQQQQPSSQQQLNQRESQQDLSSPGNKQDQEQQQQQRASQFQQQQQQQQQQQLLYQQQQQQMYLLFQQQQQQLYMQHQLQQQQTQQQQQQQQQSQQQLQQQQESQQQLQQQPQQMLQQLQQQQLLLLQQQQQQFLQLQQQQQQQIGSSGLQAMNYNFYYQQNFPANYPNNQEQRDHGQEGETSQVEGTKLQSAEQSATSYPSSPQSIPTTQ